MEKFMNYNIPGIHHVTAICDEAQQNIDFYTGLLGLRMVKQTVNFDMPDTYHLYYGDETGQPGTILTFFSWPDAPKGRKGDRRGRHSLIFYTRAVPGLLGGPACQP